MSYWKVGAHYIQKIIQRLSLYVEIYGSYKTLSITAGKSLMLAILFWFMLHLLVKVCLLIL